MRDGKYELGQKVVVFCCSDYQNGYITRIDGSLKNPSEFMLVQGMVDFEEIYYGVITMEGIHLQGILEQEIYSDIQEVKEEFFNKIKQLLES